MNTSPAGRITRRVTDALGRTTRLEVNGLTPVDFAYDTDGRLKTVTQGTRIVQYGYFGSGAAKGFLQSVMDPLGISTTTTRDSLGRTLAETRASTTTSFSWDPLGNLTSLTPPGQPEHVMSYTPVNLLDSYAPPGLNASNWSTSYDWDLDRNITLESRPGNVSLEYLYDSAGRISHTITPTGVLERSYYPAGTVGGGASPGKLATLAGPGEVMLSFGYDGALQTSESWAGDMNGDVLWTYNNNFVPVSETVVAPSGSVSTAFGYDNDLLLTCVSPTTCTPVSSDALRITSNPQGLVTSLVQNALAESRTYNAFGELATQSVASGSTPVISFQYHTTQKPRDGLGRITEKAETFAGTTKRLGYTYDTLGRLTDVTANGSLSEHYEYDANGNRLVGQTPAGAINGVYDAQDRLLSYGANAYTYTEHGALQSKRNTQTNAKTTYQRDAFGSLTKVNLPDGRVIEYVTDGRGRRIAKKVDGVVTKQWLYRNQLAPLAELDGQGNIVATFGYATHVNVPDYMLRGGTLYRVVTDQLGSVRLVVSTSNASDVLFRAEYSAFGQMTVLTGSADSVGFGFAGGMFDADTALVRFGARDYDAELGRWVSKDPTLFGGGQANLYVYTQNDPVNFVDPDGREAVAATLLLWGAGFIEGSAAAAAAPVAAAAAVGTLVYVVGTQAINGYFNTIEAGQNAEAIAMASAASWAATDALWYAKGGKERVRHTDLQHLDDTAVRALYDAAKGAARKKFEEELKGRRQKNKRKRENMAFFFSDDDEGSCE